MSNLNDLRRQIDSVDEQIIALLAERFAASEEIAVIKKKDGKAIFDPTREDLLFSKIASNAQGAGLNPQRAKLIYQAIVSESRRAQEAKQKYGE